MWFKTKLCLHHLKIFPQEKIHKLTLILKKQIIKSPYPAFNSAVFSIVIVVYTVRSTALFIRTINDVLNWKDVLNFRNQFLIYLKMNFALSENVRFIFFKDLLKKSHRYFLQCNEETFDVVIKT